MSYILVKCDGPESTMATVVEVGLKVIKPPGLLPRGYMAWLDNCAESLSPGDRAFVNAELCVCKVATKT
jgi:hypothetical protein